MKLAKYGLLLVSLTLSITLQSCKTEYEARPLADINLLTGTWKQDANFEFVFDAATKSGKFTKVQANNLNGFKVGDVKLKNVTAIDENTFRCDALYRGTAGFYLYADMNLVLKGDVITYNANIGSLGTISVSGQKGEYQRIK